MQNKFVVLNTCCLVYLIGYVIFRPLPCILYHPKGPTGMTVSHGSCSKGFITLTLSRLNCPHKKCNLRIEQCLWINGMHPRLQCQRVQSLSESQRLFFLDKCKTTIKMTFQLFPYQLRMFIKSSRLLYAYNTRQNYSSMQANTSNNCNHSCNLILTLELVD